MSQRSQARRVALESLDGSNRAWEQIVVEDCRSTPADIAATRIDFREWLKTLSKRRCQIAEALAKGETTKKVAKMFGVTPGRVSQIRRELKEAWEVFQGEMDQAAVASAQAV